MSYIFENRYTISVNKLYKKLKGSIIDFKINNINQDVITISYPCKNEFYELLSELELQRFGFESEFYRYVTNEGSDFKKITNYEKIINTTKYPVINNNYSKSFDKEYDTPIRSYFFSKVKDLSIWREFEDEYSNLKDNIREFLINNKNNIDVLDIDYKKYIEKNIGNTY